MQIQVLNNQTLIDIAIRYCGTIEALFDLALINEISVTGDLVPGQILKISSVDYGFQEVVNYFDSIEKEPATGLNEESTSDIVLEPAIGIGFMVIENNFTIR